MITSPFASSRNPMRPPRRGASIARSRLTYLNDTSRSARADVSTHSVPSMSTRPVRRCIGAIPIPTCFGRSRSAPAMWKQ